MIAGAVNADLEATVRLTVRGPRGQVQKVSAVVDTGYNGCLTLPSALIVLLGLAWHRRGRVTLADGSETDLDIYSGTVLWDRRKRTIPIDEADTTPLVGTGLLGDHKLNVEFRPRGKVTIELLGPP
jgi:clan AA aspartic protease